jgi:hypothetical protein
MKTTPIVCHGITFKTKKELSQYVNRIKDTINECHSIKTEYPDEYIFLNELIKRHPEYEEKVCKMVDLKMCMNKLKNGFEMVIINHDDTTTSISLPTCINSKASTIEQNVKRALRIVIQPQIDYYKRTHVLECQLCGDCDTIIHIDHVIQFEELFDKFMKEYNIKLPTTFDKITDGTNRTCLCDVDKHIGVLFYEFHKKHAVLRPLCAQCNLTRPKYKR